MLIVAEAGGVAGFLDGTRYDPRIADQPVLAASNEAAWDTVRRCRLLGVRPPPSPA